MSLIISLMYLVMNVIGLISWIKIEKKQKLEKALISENMKSETEKRVKPV